MAGTGNTIILLNPPYRKKILRDYYCSTFPKAPYYWQPIDLLSVAAILNGKADIQVIDAVARRLTASQVESIMAEQAPRAVFMLVSSLTKDADLTLAKRIKKPGRRIVIGGEIALAPDFDFAQHDAVDGLLLDFTDEGAVGFIAGENPTGRLRTPWHAPATPRIGHRYNLGIMPHHLLDNSRYRLPLWQGRFYSLLTDFGCPFNCRFCNSGRQSIGFKLRDLAEVAEEARQLKRLGAKKIFIKDMTFGADRSHAESVLSILAPYGFRLRGYLRADLITQKFAGLLKAAGFELAQIGVERPLEDVRRGLGKNIPDAVIADAFQILRRIGIDAGAHFIVGFEGDGTGTAGACIKQARALGAAYCSINIYQHRLGASALPALSGWGKHALSLCAGFNMARYNGRRQISCLWKNMRAGNR